MIRLGAGIQAFVKDEAHTADLTLSYYSRSWQSPLRRDCAAEALQFLDTASGLLGDLLKA